MSIQAISLETSAAMPLTALARGGGCACKLGPSSLESALRSLIPAVHPDLVVGLDTGDDALVWRRPDGRMLVASTDFFAPIVDDPVTFGRIAATNAASDIYAMGGQPLFGLNITAWPADQPLEVLGEILRGGQLAAQDGGWVVAGGHSIDSVEPLYGQAIVGEVAEDRLLTNAGARPGQSIVLTKSIGGGAILTAAKARPDDERHRRAADVVVVEMCRLNDKASIAANEAGSTACTDVTGFGLLGHLAKMMAASGCTAELDTEAVPVLDGAQLAIAEGFAPGGTSRNLDWLGDRVVGGDAAIRQLLADPQTSGGLLFCCPPGQASIASDKLSRIGHQSAVVGRVIDRQDHDIVLSSVG